MESSFSSIEMRIQNQQNSQSQLRFKIGKQPHYIPPKDNQITTSQPQILSQSQFNSSMAVPNFHSPSLGQSISFSQHIHKDKKPQVTQEFTQLHNQNKQNYLSSKFIFLYILIWIFYLIGSIDSSNDKISGFHIFDCIGNSLAFILVIFTIYAKKSLNSFSQVLHIWSILLTITFLVYPIKKSSSQSSDQTFLQIVNILRSFRLGFPLFIRESPHVFCKKGLHVTLKSRKIVIFTLIICFLLGLFCYQTFSDSIGNRCRQSAAPFSLDTWIPIDKRLCGQRICPNDSYCRNPKIFGFLLNKQQTQIKSFGSGLYTFDSSWHSAVSIFQMFTLNAWGKISQMYFDVYPGWISVPFYIIGYVVFEKLFMSLLVIFFQIMKQKREKLEIFAGPSKNKPDNSIHISHDEVKIEFHDVAISKIQSIKSFMSHKNQKQKTQNIQKQNKMGLITKIIIYILVFVISALNIILASQFGLHPTNIEDDLYNRKIGVSLILFFIFHFTILNLIKYQFLDQEEDETDNFMRSSQNIPTKHQCGFSLKQTIDTIVTLQSCIFYISLADYIVRIAEGKYILQEPSGLTSLTHFTLALRLYYLYLGFIEICNFPTLKSHFVTIVKTFKSVFKFLFVIVVFASLLGAISYNINKNNHSNEQKATAFTFQVNRFFMLLINHSWQSLFNYSISQGFVNQQSLFIQIVGGICLIIGSMIFMRYLIGHLIHQSFWQGLHGQQKCREQTKLQLDKKSKKSIKSMKSTTGVKTYKQFVIKDEDDQQKTLKKQKSFHIFSFQNCLRQSASDIVKDNYYQDIIKFRFYIVYICINLICCIACDSKVYGIISTIMEAIILLDILLTAIAIRFTGDYSYSENKFTNITHFIFCFVVIILSLTQFQLHFIPLIQTLRIFVLFNYYESFKQTFTFIQNIFKTIILHFLILIPILFGYALMIILILSGKNQNDSFGFKFVEGFKLGLIIICQKGWDINRIFGSNNQSSFFGQLTIFVMLITWISFTLSFFYSLAGIIISLLVKKKNKSEQKIKKQLCGSNTMLEEHKIKQKIAKIKPKFSINLYASGHLIKICQHKIFQIMKRLCCLGSIICFLVLNTQISQVQRIAIYTAHLFFFTSEILLFIFQSITYDRHQQHYFRDLVLSILAIPGAYIGFINPVKYSTQSYELKVILLLFNSLTLVRFVKVIHYFPVLQKIYTFLRQKMSQTFNTSAIILISTISSGFYLFLIMGKQQSIIQCINYAFVGIIGGDFHFSIQNLIQRNNFSFTYEIHLLYLMVHILNIFLKNLFIAFVIYQISDFTKQKMPLINTEFNLYNFNKFFHENQFVDQWMKIDPQGKGFVNYTCILHKSHHFIKHFSITTLPYKSYSNRVQTFKKLKVHTYEAETVIQKQDCPKPQIRKQFVITFYDFLYSLSKFAFREMSSNKLLSKDNYFIKNLTFADQPISIINIGGDQHRLSNFSTKGVNLDKRRQQINEEWRKKSYDLSKQNMQEKFENYPQIQGIQSTLRISRFNSQEIYFAHRIKNKVLKYLKSIQKVNQIKRHEQVRNFRHKKLTI